MTSNIYSNFKLAWFNDKLISLRDGTVTAPIYVRIKPINRCNHNCFFCVYRSELSNMHNEMNDLDRLSREKLLEILDDFRIMGVKAVTYSGGGEPLIHRDIVEVLDKTKANGIDLSIITNGQLLSGDRAAALTDAKWVRISMDYYDAGSFIQSGRGTARTFDAIIKNIDDFARRRKSGCNISVNFIITKNNYHQIEYATILLKNLGVDNVRFSPVWFDDFLAYHEPIREQVLANLQAAKKHECDTFKIYHSYRIEKDQMSRTYHKCFIQQIIPAIGADYNVYNCHNKSYSFDAIIGNIRNQSFRQMWFSEETKKHFMEFDAMKCCNCQCANDAKNKFLHDIISAYGDNYV